MGRLMGIDYGTKRIGLAVTDPLGIIASPLCTVANAEFEVFLAEYLKKEKVDAFIIGKPSTLRNEPSNTASQISGFAKRLGLKYPDLPIHFIDERFTSQLAFQTMIDGGLGKKARGQKALVDRISAAIILQSFLDKNKFAKNK